MKLFVNILIMALLTVGKIYAQTFTQQLQKKEPGKACIKLYQSKEITQLVDGITDKNNIKKQEVKQNENEKNKTIKKENISKPNANKNIKHNTETKVETNTNYNSKGIIIKEKADSAKKADSLKKYIPITTHTPKQDKSIQDFDIPTIDLRKKVMRRSYKTNGYRVQAFAGGNTRADKIKAQQIGNKIKMNFPDQPVYVHFYSPRWICRIGNFKSLNEATKMLKSIKKIGLKQATIVKGKITVQY